MSRENKGTIPKDLKDFINSDNIVDSLTEDMLKKIGSQSVLGAKKDEESRAAWRDTLEDALKVATQVKEEKNTPWPGAANIKYPLLSEACIQYNARVMPEFIRGNQVVRIDIMNADSASSAMNAANQANQASGLNPASAMNPANQAGAMNEDNPANQAGAMNEDNGLNAASAMNQANQSSEEDRAVRIGRHMSYQCLHQIKNWRRDTDRLLMTLPLFGTVYRKSYYDPIDRKPRVDFCLPFDVIINNSAPDLASAQRITHVIHLSTNELVERMRGGLYADIPIDELLTTETEDEYAEVDYETDQESELHEIYEQHTRLDLDEDGYKEPYIVVVHTETEKVLRIVARYDEDSFVFSKTGDLVKIKAQQFFTDYHFLPSPDGTFHSIGLGTLLYPLNETINTIYNQLLDAGTLSNRQAGFIGKSLRVRKEDLRLKPGEWRQINAPSGQTISQNIVPLPIKEPSQALFQILGVVTQSAKELVNVSDVLQGQLPQAGTPATTVMAVVEQGTKVFSAMMERLFISFQEEYQKLYDLNKKYISDYVTYDDALISKMISNADYKAAGYGVFPIADPSQASDMHRLAQAQALIHLLEVPGINKHEVLERYLKALRIPDIEKVLPTPNPQAPPPPGEILQMEAAQAQLENLRLQNADLLMRRTLEALRLNTEEEQNEQKAMLQQAQASAKHADSVSKLAETETLAGQAETDLATKQVDAMNKTADLHSQMIENQAELNKQGIEERVAAIENMMSKLAGINPAQGGQPGPGVPQGPPGSQGAQGPQGPQGPEVQQEPQEPQGQEQQEEQ